MTEDSTNRTLIAVMIIIGIVIIILLVTGGYFGRTTLAYNTNGSLYAASALPFGSTVGEQGVVYNNGYPVVTRSVPTGYTAPVRTTSSGSSSTTTTTYNTYPATTTVTPTTSYYPTTYQYTTAPTYYPSNTYYTTNGYYPTSYNNSCPTDTMVCPDGMVVGRAGPYCAFTLCQ